MRAYRFANISKRVAAQMDAPTITVPPANDAKEKQIADLIQQNSDLLKEKSKQSRRF